MRTNLKIKRTLALLALALLTPNAWAMESKYARTIDSKEEAPKMEIFREKKMSI
jgi:hypothetical protein